MYSITANSFGEWRNAARTLLGAGISPQAVHWQSDQQAGLFDSCNLESIAANKQASASPTLTVPAQFISQAKKASCFIDINKPNEKWAVLYSLLWRIRHIDKHTLLLKSDPEVQALQRMSKAVNRDKHKMKAFVRFKCVNEDESQRDRYYTAWFEPAHAIMELTAPFFVQRFTSMNWSILTPHGCAHWNQSQLTLSPGIERPEIKEDQYDEFWRAYYCNIFNPARLKEQAMQSEMPKKYWKYLPEATCIKDLSRSAAAAVDNMVQSGTTNSERVRTSSKSVAGFQDKLRSRNRE